MEKMKGNKNAEKWTFEEAEELLKKAVEISRGKEFDFIGEVAFKQKTYHMVYHYIVDKFKALKPLLDEVKHKCESNCFYNGKKGNIVPSMAIMNLKSNHGWTDRVETDVTTKGKEINNTPIINFVKSDDEQ